MPMGEGMYVDGEKQRRHAREGKDHFLVLLHRRLCAHRHVSIPFKAGYRSLGTSTYAPAFTLV